MTFIFVTVYTDVDFTYLGLTPARVVVRRAIPGFVRTFRRHQPKRHLHIGPTQRLLRRQRDQWYLLLLQRHPHRTPPLEEKVRISDGEIFRVLTSSVSSSELLDGSSFGDRKISNIQPQNRGGGSKPTGTSYNFDKV